MGRGKGDINPVVLKIGFVLAFSLGGMIFKLIRNKVIKPSQSPSDSSKYSDSNDQRISPGKSTQNSCKFDPLGTDKHEELHNSIPNLSPSRKSNADKDYYLLPEFNDLVKEFDAMKTNPDLPPVKKDSHEQEVNNLKNTVKLLKEREQNLENQLLELYGLKEQDNTVKELQNRLKLNNMESKVLALKVGSLQNDNKRLESQMADYNKVLMDLEDAQAKIKALKKKLRLETELNKERILDLQLRVEKMKKDEDKVKGGVGIDLEMELNVCKLKDLEDEAEELRKSNESLRVDKIELTRKLEHVQKLATSVLEDEKAEKLKKESQRLKKKNEDLTKEIEKLQAERCSDIEELVYLRWINACLRYELRNHQPAPGKTTARYLSKTLSPKSEQKAKTLILEYAYKEGEPETSINIPELDSDQCSSSQSSNENFIDYSLHHKSNHKFLGKLVKFLRGKDDHITAHNHHDHHHDRRHDHRQPSRSRNSFLEQVDMKSSSVNLMFSCKQKLRHRHSDVGICKRSELVGKGGGVIGDNGGGGGGLDSPSSSDGQKSELVKYAEALKDPSPNIRAKYRSRSMSFSSF